MDRTIKVRGMRVNLTEIEFHFSKIEGISEFVIKPFTDKEETFICAYYSTTSKEPIDNTKLKKTLSNNLNEYMIPAYFIHVLNFKRGSHGKIDNDSLTLPTTEGKENNKNKEIKDEALGYILTITKDILHDINISPNDNLISLGLNSLGAMSLQSAISKKYNLDISAYNILTLNTPIAISKEVKKLQKGKLQKKNYQDYSFSNHAPINGSQLNIDFDEESKKAINTPYNNPIKIVLLKSYSSKTLQAAIYKLTKIYPILKARVNLINNSPHLIFDANIDVAFKQKTYIKDDDFVRPFNLSKCLCRFEAVCKNNKKILYADFHCLIVDEKSISVLFNTLLRYLKADKIDILQIILDTDLLKKIKFSEQIDSMHFKTSYELPLCAEKKFSNNNSELENVLFKVRKKSKEIISSANKSETIVVPISEPQLSIYTDYLAHDLKQSYTTALKFELDNNLGEDDIYDILEKLYEQNPIFNCRIKNKEDNSMYLFCDSFINWCGFFSESDDKEIIEALLNQGFHLEDSLLRFFGVFNDNSKKLVCVIHHLIYDYRDNIVTRPKFSNKYKLSFIKDFSKSYNRVLSAMFKCSMLGAIERKI